MKKLILCCDGTWNRADQETEGKPCPTNVIKIAYRIAKRDGATPQILFYDQGVGTGNVVDRYSGGAFGDGLEDNIYDAYRFLIANYEAGDEIFIFGFSRGAFTARSIGGLIRNCGILRRDMIERYSEARAIYQDPKDGPDDPRSVKFKEESSVCGREDVPIKLIGVWDTVGSLGIPLRGLRGLTRKDYQFHDVELSKTVQLAYHALAIDEHRAPFEPTLWMHKPKPGQTVEQVWFCGAHSDVGGGYPEKGLSDITLDWMIGKARGAGLVFDDATMAAHPIHPDPLAKITDSKTGLYNMTPGIDRQIGKAAERSGEQSEKTDPTQSIHPSVLQRWDKDGKYRPRALKDYFTRAGDPRGKS